MRIGEVDGVVVVFVAGELDTRATAQMSSALMAGCLVAGDRVAVDVSGLAFMDVAGLRVLLRAHSRLRREGRAGIVVRGAAGSVRRVFALTGSTSLLGDSPPAAGPGYPPPRVPGSGRELENGRQQAGLSLNDLFVAYFALGGTAGFPEMVAHLGGSAEVLDAHQRDVLALALHERLADLGRTGHSLSWAAGQRQSAMEPG